MRKEVLLAGMGVVCRELSISNPTEFAEELVNQACEETRKLSEVLKDEYGIEAVAFPVTEIRKLSEVFKDEYVIEPVAFPVTETECLKKKRKNKSCFFVPRTIGRPQKKVASVGIKKNRRTK